MLIKARTRLTALTMVAILFALLLSTLTPRSVSAADGDLDPTFNGGLVTTSFDGPAGAEDIAIQADGKIVAAGFARSTKAGTQNFALTRYNTNGVLDGTFGAGGRVTTDFAGCASVARAVVVQPDGKIIAAGTACIGTPSSDLALARYNTNGTPDGSFGLIGLVTTDVMGREDEIFDIVLQDDGKIIVAGRSDSDFLVARYDTDGMLDDTFGTNGITLTSFPGQIASEARGVALLDDGRIVLAGTVFSGAGNNIGLARYDTAGMPDGTFGMGGIAVAPFPSTGNAVDIQGVDKMVVGGTVEGGYGIARFNGDGTPDTLFGVAGRVNVNGLQGEARDVIALPNDKILAAGFAFDPMAGDQFVLVRLTGAGALDQTFGMAGVVVTGFTNLADQANGVLVQPDGKIVAGGIANAGGLVNSVFALARYLSEPAPAGTDTVGVFSPTDSRFFLKDSNTFGIADLTFQFGPPDSGWTPIDGDWNANGADTVGLFNPTDSIFFLKNTNSVGPADITVQYGPAGAGWSPVIGDWNGDGADTIGLFDPVTSVFFLKNTNIAGPADLTFQFGPAGAGWIPIAGDWDGDGIDTVGLYDPTNNEFFLRNTNTVGPADIMFDGIDAAGNVPLAGDFDADGVDTVGQYNPATGQFSLKNMNAAGPADLIFPFGPAGAGWFALIGDWDGL